MSNEVPLPEGMNTRNPVLAKFSHESKWQPEWLDEPIENHIFEGKVGLVAAWKHVGESVYITFVDNDINEQGMIYTAPLSALKLIQGDWLSLPVWGELDNY